MAGELENSDANDLLSHETVSNLPVIVADADPQINLNVKKRHGCKRRPGGGIKRGTLRGASSLRRKLSAMLLKSSPHTRHLSNVLI